MILCPAAQHKIKRGLSVGWPRQWGKLTVRPGTQPDFLEMQSFTRSEWRPRKSARGLEREADARINLSAALEVAAEDVFGIEPKIGIAAQRQVGANTGVIPSFFVGVGEVDRRGMASGSEDVISLELAEHVAVDIRRAEAFSRTQREAAAGTETNSADDAVGIRNLSLDAALRFKPSAFNADDLKLCLRFNKEEVIQLKFSAQLSTHAVERLPKRSADFLAGIVSEVVVTAETTDLRIEVSIAAALAQDRVIKVQSIAIAAAAAGNAEEICIRTRIVKGQADNFVTFCRGYFLVVADLDHVFIHVKCVLTTDI